MKDTRWWFKPKKYGEDKDESLIPEGMYCYDGNYTCPYWGKKKPYDSQENGYCDFIEKGDWEINGLLWDQCKSCGINCEIKEDEIGEIN